MNQLHDKSTVRSAFLQVVLLRGVFALVSLGSVIVFGRLLSAREFGLMALTTLSLTLIGIVRDFGFAPAAIQRESLTQDDRDDLFWMNFGSSVVTFAFALLIAPAVALLYGEPDLTSVMQVCSISYLLWGLQAQHAANLRRAMSFGPIVRAEGVGVVAGLAAGAIVAYWRQDVWGLVVNNLAHAAVTATLMFFANPWLPGRFRRPREIKRLLVWGRDYMSYNLTNYFSENWSQLLIGIRFDTTELGHFNRAMQIFMLPSALLLKPMQEVATPFLSRAQNDGDAFSRHYTIVLQRTTLLMFTLAALLPLISVELVRVLLGPRWPETGEILAWFAPALAAQAVIVPVQVGLLCQGRVSDLRNLALTEFVVRLLASFAGLTWGPVGVAAATSIASVAITGPVAVAILGRGATNLNAKYQFRSMKSSIAVAAMALLTGLVVRDTVFANVAAEFGRLALVSAGGFFGGIIVALTLQDSRAALFSSFRFITTSEH